MKTQQFKKAQQSGFTLIELVMVIVIIGILAAVAVPKLANLSADANNAVINGTKGAIASSAVIMYASNKAATTKALIAANVGVSGVAVAATTGLCTFTITTAAGTASTYQIPDTSLCTD